ncbi:hypothetical protein H6F51_18195 [Cyanobacteria bacterium FACHB-DQ100]|nr:hypothetical protein [Cyanobacteria bacterium FACHB-DQ100]
MDELTDLELQTAEMSLTSISVKLKERLTFLNNRDVSILDEQEIAFLNFQISSLSSKFNSISATLNWISREIAMRKTGQFEEQWEIIDRLRVLCGETDEEDEEENLEEPE